MRAQPPAPDLLERTVLRWVDSQSVEKLRGIRFANANPLLLRSLAARGGEIGDNLQAVAALIAGDDADPARLLLTRMALLSINAAVSAAEGTELTDEQIAAAARRHALAVLARMPDRTTPNSPENG